MDLAGRTLGHYRITGEISRGGMGIVYRATDTRLNREVALKVLPDALIHDPERRRRFLQEAQAASSIEHPNVAVIYDADEDQGQTFIAMELVRGQKMSDWLARGRPPLDHALELGAEIASGLSRAHERQIVHRDLKPANVMVTDDGHAKIIDFGVAKLLEPVPTAAEETRARQETESGVVLGTMTYMSPEQARGDRIDHRSDIFSFGIVLHEMLSGQPPFQGKSGLETAGAIIHAAAPRLPALGAAVSPELAADLQRIVDKCLEKDPANRYQTTKDIAVDLRAARRRLESGAHAAQTMASAAVPVPVRQSPRWIWVAASLVVIAGVAGLWFWRGSKATSGPLAATDATKKPSVAVLYFDNTTGAQDLAWLRTGITEMVVTDLSQSQNLEVVSTDRLYAALASLRKADDTMLSPEVVTQVAEKTGVDHVIVGSYMKVGDTMRVNVRLQDVKTGRIVTSESAQAPSQSDLFQMVDDLSRRIRTKFEELRPRAAPGALVAQPGTPTAESAGLDRGLGDVTTNSIEAYKEYAEGINLHERSREPEAATRFEKAIALDPAFAMAYVKLAVVQGNMGRLDLSNKYSALALQHADRLTPRERYYIEGYYYTKTNETLARGLDAYKKCVDLDPGHQACRHNLALQLMFLERFQEAAGHYEELTRRGVTNPSSYENLANAYTALGESPKAAELLEQFVKRNPESAAGHKDLGFALMSVDRYEDALKEFSQAQLLDPTDPQPTAGRAYAEIHLENWPAARAAATSLEASSDEFHRFFGGVTATFIEEYGGRCPEAIAAADRAVAAFRTPSANTAAMRTLSAAVLLACGRAAPAVATLQKAVVEAKGDSSEASVRASMALALAVAGRQTEADAELARIAAMVTPLSATRDGRTLALARGLVAYARKDFPGAIDQLLKAEAALAPGGANFIPTDHVPIWFALGEAYVSAGRPKEAAPWFQKVVDRQLEHLFQPIEFVRSFYYLGAIRELTGDTAGAKEAYRQFVGYWKDGSIDRDRIAEAQRKLQTLK